MKRPNKDALSIALKCNWKPIWAAGVSLCDSIFEFKGEAYGKPLNKEEAFIRWKKMSGEVGFLHTGHTLIIGNFDSTLNMFKITETIKKTVSSRVYFSKLEDWEIKSYVDTREPLYCAGGFALEGIGGKYIEKIEGCFSNVMGLSLPWLRKNLYKEENWAKKKPYQRIGFFIWVRD